MTSLLLNFSIYLYPILRACLELLHKLHKKPRVCGTPLRCSHDFTFFFSKAAWSRTYLAKKHESSWKTLSGFHPAHSLAQSHSSIPWIYFLATIAAGKGTCSHSGVRLGGCCHGACCWQATSIQRPKREKEEEAQRQVWWPRVGQMTSPLHRVKSLFSSCKQ
jgi:hypothetical protein